MSSHEDVGVDDDEVSGIPKSPPNVDLDLQSLLLSILANVAKNSQVLASLMAEQNSAPIEFEGPPSKRSRAESGFPCGDDNLPQIDIDSFSMIASKAESVASTNAICVASMNANYVASTNANCVASMNANCAASKNANCVASTNGSCVASTNANTVPRSSDEDVVSLFGCPEFDVNNSEAALHDIDNNSLLSQIGDALVPSDEKGPPILDHLASIVDAIFLVEFDVEKRKEILDKYKVPKKWHFINDSQSKPRNLDKITSLCKKE